MTYTLTRNVQNVLIVFPFCETLLVQRPATMTLDFFTFNAREQTDERWNDARTVLLARFTSEHSSKLVDAILGSSPTAPHCFQRSRKLASDELAKFECAVAMAGTACVAAACFTHARPRRGAKWSQLLLVGTAVGQEQRGYDKAVIDYVRRQCQRTGS